MSESHYYLKLSDIRLFQVDNDMDPGTYVTELEYSSEGLKIPKSIYEGDFGLRKNPAEPLPLDLIVRVAKNDIIEGSDFYYETPILGPQADVSNATTALSWILRWSFEGQKIYVSYNSFNKYLQSLELNCTKCREKKVSEVVSLFLSRSDLVSSLLKTVQQENTHLSISQLNYNPPRYIFAKSSPILALQGVAAKDIKETESIRSEVVFLNPMNPTLPLRPTSWTRTFSSQSFVSNTSVYEYAFTYEDKGEHLLVPQFESDFIYSPINIIYSVEDKNRTPICTEPLVFEVQANRNISISLTSHCQDPDPEDGNINFALQSGPTGLTLNSIGLLKWVAPQAADGQPYEVSISFLMNDSKLGYQLASATLKVSPDLIPEFTLVPFPTNYTEGLSQVETIGARDRDGDTIVLKITPVTNISAGLPTGSGVLTSIVRTGTLGEYDFDWTFQPSWRQVIAADGVAQVKLSLFYDSSDPNLNSSLELNSMVVDLNIINTNDPPVWSVQPSTTITAKEDVLSTDFLGEASDAGPNTTAVTYAMETAGSEFCSWGSATGSVSTVGGQAFFNIAPSFKSDATCIFRVIATDADGLSTESSEFTVEVEDTNNPITLAAVPTTLVISQETVALSLPMDEFFYDLDYEMNDPRENVFQFQCRWDHDLNGIYDQECASNMGATQIKFSFGTENMSGYWTPTNFDAGSYAIELTVWDKGLTSATHQFTLQVDDHPAPMNVEFTTNLVTTLTNLEAIEGTNLPFYLQARAASADPIDNYTYRVNAPTCYKVGGGTCSVSFVTLPVSNIATGDADFYYQIVPSLTDGDKALPSTYNSYIINFKVENLADPLVYVEKTLFLNVNNLNRNPTALGFSTGGTFGCTGSNANTLSDKFIICIDLSKDSRSSVGLPWTKNYSMTMTHTDPDTTNDVYAYSLVTSGMPGTITGANWSFKLPACLNLSTGTVIKQYQIKVEDGRGGVLNRDVELRINKASVVGQCL